MSAPATFAENLDLRPRESDPTFTLDAQIAEARASMGEQRWSQLNAEWEADQAETNRLLEAARVKHGRGSAAYRMAVRQIMGRASSRFGEIL